MYSSRRGPLDGAKSTTACIMSLYVACKRILADFNLTVSTPTAKLPNLIPRLIFWLYGIWIIRSSVPMLVRTPDIHMVETTCDR